MSLTNLRPLTGDGKKIFIETYGCQMNFGDSEIVVSIMQDEGYFYTDKIEEADIILINTVAPLLYAYGIYIGEDKYIDRAQWIWESLRPEQNSIVRRFAAIGIEAKSALDSQAVIQLYNEYCQQKKCLYCRIGHKLLAQDAIRDE